jgi:outer membrane protein
MKQLDKRYTSLLASATWEYSSREWGRVRLKVAADILGKNEGFLADMSYSCPLSLGDVTLTPAVGLLWTSEEYNDYYYGVSQGESCRSGLSTYEAGDGISPYASMRIDYALDTHWGLYAIASAMVLSNEVHDSPMIGERVKYGIGGGVSYTF